MLNLERNNRLLKRMLSLIEDFKSKKILFSDFLLDLYSLFNLLDHGISEFGDGFESSEDEWVKQCLDLWRDLDYFDDMASAFRRELSDEELKSIADGIKSLEVLIQQKLEEYLDL